MHLFSANYLIHNSAPALTHTNSAENQNLLHIKLFSTIKDGAFNFNYNCSISENRRTKEKSVSFTNRTKTQATPPPPLPSFHLKSAYCSAASLSSKSFPKQIPTTRPDCQLAEHQPLWNNSLLPRNLFHFTEELREII